jgi:two-component system cell cycle response regulator DivK
LRADRRAGFSFLRYSAPLAGAISAALLDLAALVCGIFSRLRSRADRRAGFSFLRYSAPLAGAVSAGRGRTGYEIIETENGEEALAAIAKVRPDLILMDIQLPIMDGYTATRRIKADPALRSIPIIAITSYALSGEEIKAREAGCDDNIPKPYSPRELLAKVRQYLSD